MGGQLRKVKKQISEWIKVDQNYLHEISIDDIELADFAKLNIKSAVHQMLSFSFPNSQSANQVLEPDEGVPCKIYWVENTKDLVLYVWNDFESKAIVVPQSGWTVRADITVH
jgi:hypothetical protein